MKNVGKILGRVGIFVGATLVIVLVAFLALQFLVLERNLELQQQHCSFRLDCY